VNEVSDRDGVETTRGREAAGARSARVGINAVLVE